MYQSCELMNIFYKLTQNKKISKTVRIVLDEEEEKNAMGTVLNSTDP